MTKSAINDKFEKDDTKGVIGIYGNNRKGSRMVIVEPGDGSGITKYEITHPSGFLTDSLIKPYSISQETNSIKQAVMCRKLRSSSDVCKEIQISNSEMNTFLTAMNKNLMETCGKGADSKPITRPKDFANWEIDEPIIAALSEISEEIDFKPSGSGCSIS